MRVAGLVGKVVDGDLVDRLIGEEEADGNIAEWSELDSDGIADGQRSGRDDDRGRPPKVRVAGEVIAPSPALKPMPAAPTVSGSLPNSLLRTIRAVEPPREMWTISRRVVSPEMILPSGLSAMTGDAPHVPTQ